MNQLTPQLEQILSACAVSSKVTAKSLFGERFSRSFDKKHDEILEALDDDSIQKVVIAAPRGIGKTSLANFLKPARSILFQKHHFILPISQSLTSAKLGS